MSYRNGIAAIAAVAFLGLVSVPAVSAETGTPSFATQSAANANIRGGYNAYARGDYKDAVTFNKRATKKGLRKSRRSIAYANLCASYGQLGDLDAALEACNTAMELSPKNWRAGNNRGVVEFLAGNKMAALADFTASAALPDANIAQANADMMAATKMAASR